MTDDGPRRDQPRIYNDPWYEHDEGATFSLAFDPALQSTLRGFVSDLDKLELAIIDESLLLSGVGAMNHFAYSMVVDASRFEAFDVAEPGYLTVYAEPLLGALKILKAATDSATADCTMHADGDGVELLGPKAEFGAQFPAQSRYGVSADQPPGTDADFSGSFDDVEHIVTTIADPTQAVYSAADPYREESSLEYAELATADGDAWLTFTDTEDAHRVELTPAGGDAYALYKGENFRNAIGRSLSVSSNPIEIEFGDDFPAILAGSADGIEFNAYVAPRLPDEPRDYWEGAETARWTR